MNSNKTVVIFLIKFFGVYAVLFFMYSFFLDTTQKATNVFACDPITKTVAKQTGNVLNALGYETVYEQDTKEYSVKLIVNNVFVSRVIEGCNAIAIIILFISFIIAFSSDFKTTFIYILIGSLCIYVFNILRIAFITIALYKYPQYQYMLHDVVFPIIIYGVTFILWFIWVKKFSRLKR